MLIPARILAFRWPANPRGLVLLVICLLVPIGSIRSITTVMALGADLICSRIPGLTEKQRHLCQTYPDAMVAIGSGSKLSLAECQEQFKFYRWNCSAVTSQHGFGHVIIVGSREAAFLYAVWSAGLTYSISQACSRGWISTCGCDARKKGKAPPSAVNEVGGIGGVGWKWGGCSADVRFGSSLSQRFVDSREMEGDDRSLMNLHNNRVGRKSVKLNLLTECKCHGVSGSCTLRTCWQRLPPFRQIGDYLMKRYHSAKRIMAKKSSSGNDSKPGKMLTLQLRKGQHHRHRRKKIADEHYQYQRTTRDDSAHLKPRPSELVYLQPSPNYCEADPATGSLGVAGRKCNRTSAGPDGCDLLCCGRGYNTHQYTRISQCHCKFHWCCRVTCDKCSERIEEYTCK